MANCRCVFLVLLSLLLAMAGIVSGAATGPVVVVEIEGVIGPATADFTRRSFAQARDRDARLIVLKIDTPGGLDQSMRQIIQDILASPVPIATFVAPEGARAASAGTYILYASHIAAMAPATNLGAATPVSIGPGDLPRPEPDSKGGDKGKAGDKGDKGSAERHARSSPDAMREKAVNDAAAYIRGLAELRGRNAEFAEQAVREANSLSANEALKRSVIEVVAADVPDLIRQIDGRAVTLQSGKVTLALGNAAVETMAPDMRTRVLAVLTNPMLAMVLMMIGVYGLFVEFTSPGFGVPGVAGAIALLLALYAFHMLPVNWVGVALIGLGAVLMIAEVFMPTFGAIGVGGIIAVVAGGLLLIDADDPAFRVSWPEVTLIALVSAAAIVAFGAFALKSHRRPVVSGREEMLGAHGTVVAREDGITWAEVRGERWRVRSRAPLTPGDVVRVAGIEGLTLEVTKQSNEGIDHAV